MSFLKMSFGSPNKIQFIQIQPQVKFGILSNNPQLGSLALPPRNFVMAKKKNQQSIKKIQKEIERLKSEFKKLELRPCWGDADIKKKEKDLLNLKKEIYELET